MHCMRSYRCCKALPSAHAPEWVGLGLLSCPTALNRFRLALMLLVVPRSQVCLPNGTKHLEALLRLPYYGLASINFWR